MVKITSYSVQFLLIFNLSVASFAWADVGKPKYGPHATPLSQSHEYFRKNPATQFWKLIPYYVPQMDDSACSVATVAMIVNAALSGKKLTTADQLATQKDLLKKVNAPAWKGPLTYATRGVTLDELGPIIESSLKAYGVTPVQIETVHTDQVNEGTQKKLHETLVQVENSNNQFMAVNFDQAVYTNDMEVGHIAAVGAYDAQKKQVLILDPDRKWFEPYWVSEEIFLKGMATLDAKQAKKHRGYIRIKLPEHQ